MLKPESETELSAVIADAGDALSVQGGGTRIAAFGDGHPVLSAAGLSGIHLYEPGAMTLVAGAGTPLGDIEKVLKAEGQQLAFEPMDHRGLLGRHGVPTIGGVVAGNISGPRRINVGACRDFLLGVRFVDGMGRVIKNGGRVMKNVTGYDLVKLMAGSFGTLGVLSQVSLKVLPKPASNAMLSLTGLSNRDALQVMTRALGSPYEVTGAAHAPVGPDGSPVTMIRLEGFETSLAYRADRLAALFADIGKAQIDTETTKVTALWHWVRDVQGFHNVDGDVWRISVKPGDGPEIAEHLQALGVLFDWGGGLIWALTPEGTDIRARLGAFQGHATLIRASKETYSRLPVFQPEPAPLAALSAGLRHRFDPRSILNPELMS